MFASKKLSLNEWKNWAIGLVGNTMSSIDQATSRWFWSLINGLPRDYFAKTFDQVNYLDKRVWEGMFRARIDEIKEQLELEVSESIFEADLLKLQGLVGKYSLSPVTYEDGLEELENFISTLGNGDNYLKILREVRNEFREELKLQPALLKECIEGEANLGRKEGEYYKSLLDDRSLKNTSPERVISESPILDKAAVSKRGNNNYKLRNISKLLFSNPGQALTLFLAAQSAFASAANIQMSNSTGLAIGNDTLSFDNNLSNLSEFKGRINENVSPNSISKSSNFRNSNKVRKEIEVVERDLDGRSTEIRRDTGELVEVLTYVKSQRSKRAANELDSEMETVSENQEEIIIGLENRVKALDKEIKQLKNSFSASDERYKEQISSLEGQLIVLQRSFNDMKRQSSQTLSEKANEIKGLSAIVKNLRKQVEDLNKKIQENERRHLPDDCIKDIESSSFKIAEEKLKKINNDTAIEYIVDRVYKNNAEGRFSLLLEFGKNLGSIPLKLSVYAHLNNEMSKANNSNDDIFKFIELAETVKSLCVDQQNLSSKNNILKRLTNLIKNMAVGELRDAMKNKTYDKGDRSSFKISKAVFSLNKESFKDLITKVIDDVYDTVDKGSVILDFIYQSECPGRMYGYEAILKKMKDQNHLDFRSEAVELARCVKDLMNGVLCGPGEKMIAQSLKNELPGHLQVAIFAEKVCIKNVKYNEYLYAASGGFNYDSSRRRVFTWIPKNMVFNGYWILSSDKGGYFTIKNTKESEYLYTTSFQHKYKSLYHEDLKDCHGEQKCYGRGVCHYEYFCSTDIKNAFTWIPGTSDPDSKWNFIHNDKGIIIRSKLYSGYQLYASDYLFDSDRRNLAVVNFNSLIDQEKALWKIEDCSNMRRRRDVDEAQSYSEPSSRLSDVILDKAKGSNSSFISR